MKKSTILSIWIIALMMIISFSCKKEVGPTGPQGPAGPGITGTLQGFVQLYDQYGDRVFHPVDGTELQIGSTTVYTDTTGKYTFNLVTGTYNIDVFRQNGNYGQTIIQGLQFTGGTGGEVDHDVALSQIPTFTISTLTVKDTSFPPSNPVQYVKITGTVDSVASKARTVAVFINTNATVSCSTLQYLMAYDPANPVIPANSNSFTFNIKSNAIYLGTGLAPSQTAYFAVYPAAVDWNNTSNYLDFNTDRKIFNAIGSTPTTANVVMQ